MPKTIPMPPGAANGEPPAQSSPGRVPIPAGATVGNPGPDPRVLQMVNDPEFAKLSVSDQKGVLGAVDPDFHNIPDADVPQVVSRLATPVPQPKVDMQESAVGNVMSSPQEYAETHPGTGLTKAIQVGQGIDKAGQAVTAGNAAAGIATIAGAELGPYVIKAVQTPIGRVVLKEVLRGTVNYEVLKHLFGK